MLQRSPISAAAIRARRWRAQRKAGLREVRILVHVRRLRAALAALRKANSRAGSLDSWDEIEAELAAVVEEFVVRWVGKK
jgi:hypothetical protein